MMASLTEGGFFSQMISSFVASMPNTTISVKYTLVRNAKSNEIGSARIGTISGGSGKLDRKDPFLAAQGR
jgi:hypothetical protein